MSHQIDHHGQLVHFGEIVEVKRSRPPAERRACFQLRLAAADGAKPGLLLDGIAVGTDALLAELRYAVGVRMPALSLGDGGSRDF